ncbi:MAG: tRNA (adenosine(37)-N6)-dimethylallyltransferase MiaA [Thermoanaerobaculia bacterium]|nr:tRNA (adenosine(37)-N6)-dimethylallyltransferase MiaA [Thermoanaerobaculia bacterium]
MKLVVIAGPTGTGKSELAVRLAQTIGGEIVNFDSVQIYRGFDIGSAKPQSATRHAVPHHLFDIIDATEEFNAADFATAAKRVCSEISARGRLPILTGGTYFYLRALLAGLPEMPARDEALRARIRRIAATPRGSARLHSWLGRVDPSSAARIASEDRHRVERALEVWITSGRAISTFDRPSSESPEILPALKLALILEQATLHSRLDARVEEMYRSGLVEETRALLQGFPPDARPFGAIGYREAAAVVSGALDLEAAIEETKRRTRAYAKRQMTWLRSERNVHWLGAAEQEESFAAALRLIEGFKVE